MRESSKLLSGTHLWLVLLKSFHSLEACAARDLRGTGLGDSDFRVLEILLHKGAMPVNTLGPKVFLTPGSISTAVDRLHSKGLVSRVHSETDRRVHLVNLTAKGRRMIERIFSAHAHHMEELTSVLTPAERLCLLDGLKKLGKHAARENR
jgi:MarR family 2-MHQ and catechol resistance regulon transcriptional repressor